MDLFCKYQRLCYSNTFIVYSWVGLKILPIFMGWDHKPSSYLAWPAPFGKDSNTDSQDAKKTKIKNMRTSLRPNRTVLNLNSKACELYTVCPPHSPISACAIVQSLVLVCNSLYCMLLYCNFLCCNSTLFWEEGLHLFLLFHIT